MRYASVFELGLLAAGLGLAPRAAAQELPRVSVQHALRVGGVVAESGEQDLIGLSRVEFQGLIAAELASVGYLLESDDGAERAPSALPPLTLVGSVKEEICDDEAPSQCRIAIQWELQDARGAVVYRTITRSVDQAQSLEKLRRGLIEGALRSLLQRRRFTLQLIEEPKLARGHRYVRDRDDPPFALTKRYTYGTSTSAHRLRTAGVVSAAIGGLDVAVTWLRVRSSPDLPPAAHTRLVVLNDIGWGLLGVGAASFCLSYAWPEGHDIVAVQSAQRARERRVFVGMGPAGVVLGGNM